MRETTNAHGKPPEALPCESRFASVQISNIMALAIEEACKETNLPRQSAFIKKLLTEYFQRTDTGRAAWNKAKDRADGDQKNLALE